MVSIRLMVRTMCRPPPLLLRQTRRSLGPIPQASKACAYCWRFTRPWALSSRSRRSRLLCQDGERRGEEKAERGNRDAQAASVHVPSMFTLLHPHGVTGSVQRRTTDSFAAVAGLRTPERRFPTGAANGRSGCSVRERPDRARRCPGTEPQGMHRRDFARRKDPVCDPSGLPAIPWRVAWRWHPLGLPVAQMS